MLIRGHFLSGHMNSIWHQAHASTNPRLVHPGKLPQRPCHPKSESVNPVLNSDDVQSRMPTIPQCLQDIEAAQREIANELQSTIQRPDPKSWDDDERAGPRPGALDADAEAQFVWEQQQGFGRGRGAAGRGNGPGFGRGLGRWPGYGRGGADGEGGSFDRGYPQESLGSPRGLGSGGGLPPQGEATGALICGLPGVSFSVLKVL